MVYFGCIAWAGAGVRYRLSRPSLCRIIDPISIAVIGGILSIPMAFLVS